MYLLGLHHVPQQELETVLHFHGLHRSDGGRVNIHVKNVLQMAELSADSVKSSVATLRSARPRMRVEANEVRSKSDEALRWSCKPMRLATAIHMELPRLVADDLQRISADAIADDLEVGPWTLLSFCRSAEVDPLPR